MSFALAKPALDVGFYSNGLAACQSFWADDVGLTYQELLKTGEGLHQHRYGMHGGVLKQNVSREPLPRSDSGLVRLRVAADIDAPRSLVHPDGVEVEVVPMGHDGIRATEITLAVSSVDQTAMALLSAMAAERAGGRLQIGETLIALDHRPNRPPTTESRAAGCTYLTVQVFDVHEQHARFLRKGFTEGRPPARFGDVASISFVRLPDGDWLELSQRANLTGPLD
ncbi:MAG: VOC family protein [Actinomycetota bacterium]|nr:VOC family protein [Actinomycetota bacterium]